MGVSDSTTFLLFLVGSKPRMYAALLCAYKNILFGSGKPKILVFEIPSHKKQKTDDSPEQSVPWNFKN